VFVEQNDQRDRVWSQMRTRRAEGIGRLERMPALEASTTLHTAAHMHVESAHVRLHQRQILLDLARHPRLGHASAAVGTRRRQRHVDGVIDRRRRLAVRMPAMLTTWTSPRLARIGFRGPLRERRGLAFPRAARALQRLRQSVNLSPQAIAFPLQLRVLVTEPIILAFDTFPLASELLSLATQPLHVLLEIIVRRGTPARPTHAPLCQNRDRSTRKTR
jgi:hypothetical protein